MCLGSWLCTMLYTSLSRRRRCICKRIQISRALLFSFFDLLCLSQCCSASAVFFIPVVNTPAAYAVVTQICFCRTTSFMIFVFTKTAFCTYRHTRLSNRCLFPSTLLQLGPASYVVYGYQRDAGALRRLGEVVEHESMSTVSRTAGVLFAAMLQAAASA